MRLECAAITPRLPFASEELTLYTASVVLPFNASNSRRFWLDCILNIRVRCNQLHSIYRWLPHWPRKIKRVNGFRYLWSLQRSVGGILVWRCSILFVRGSSSDSMGCYFFGLGADFTPCGLSLLRTWIFRWVRLRFPPVVNWQVLFCIVVGSRNTIGRKVHIWNHCGLYGFWRTNL